MGTHRLQPQTRGVKLALLHPDAHGNAESAKSAELLVGSLA